MRVKNLWVKTTNLNMSHGQYVAYIPCVGLKVERYITLISLPTANIDGGKFCCLVFNTKWLFLVPVV